MALREIHETLEVRRVRLRVANVAWMENYHGREAGLLDKTVDALEVKTAEVVAFVDDRDGQATELFDAWRNAPEDEELETKRALREHALRRFLHGTVTGVRA